MSHHGTLTASKAVEKFSFTVKRSQVSIPVGDLLLFVATQFCGRGDELCEHLICRLGNLDVGRDATILLEVNLNPAVLLQEPVKPHKRTGIPFEFCHSFHKRIIIIIIMFVAFYFL